MTISRPICPFCGEEITTYTGACYQCGKGAKEVRDANRAAAEAKVLAARPTQKSQKKSSRLLNRKRVTMMLVAVVIVASLGGVIIREQREIRWVTLRESDPAAYLSELFSYDQNRWFDELKKLDPEAHAAEASRRTAKAEAEYFAKCSDKKNGEAYVMMQEDVRRSLRAPSTAKFPGRFDSGTRLVGNCIYRVVGHFDAQNGFGAMIRGTFTGTTQYFPERGSWLTLTLDVQG